MPFFLKALGETCLLILRLLIGLICHLGLISILAYPLVLAAPAGGGTGDASGWVVLVYYLFAVVYPYFAWKGWSLFWDRIAEPLPRLIKPLLMSTYIVWGMLLFGVVAYYF